MTLYGTQGAPPRALLSFALARALGLTRLPAIAHTAHGKPYFPTLPHIQCNWSHSGDYVLCALSQHSVGVDIEVIRPRRASLPSFALTEAEQAELCAMGGDWPAFYAIWTRKEAWCKYTGAGLRASWGQTPPKGMGLHYGAYAGMNWRAAVCGEEPPPAEILWIGKESLL